MIKFNSLDAFKLLKISDTNLYYSIVVHLYIMMNSDWNEYDINKKC